LLKLAENLYKSWEQCFIDNPCIQIFDLIDQKLVIEHWKKTQHNSHGGTLTVVVQVVAVCVIMMLNNVLI